MKRYAVSFITIIILLVGLIFWNIGSGSISISWDELWNILLKHTEEGTAYHIIWDIRLPRILAAGGSLVDFRIFTADLFWKSNRRSVCAWNFFRCQTYGSTGNDLSSGKGNYNQFFWNGSSSLCRLTSGNGICTFNFHEGT